MIAADPMVHGINVASVLYAIGIIAGLLLLARLLLGGK